MGREGQPGDSNPHLVGREGRADPVAGNERGQPAVGRSAHEFGAGNREATHRAARAFRGDRRILAWRGGAVLAECRAVGGSVVSISGPAARTGVAARTSAARPAAFTADRAVFTLSGSAAVVEKVKYVLGGNNRRSGGFHGSSRALDRAGARRRAAG